MISIVHGGVGPLTDPLFVLPGVLMGAGVLMAAIRAYAVIIIIMIIRLSVRLRLLLAIKCYTTVRATPVSIDSTGHDVVPIIYRFEGVGVPIHPVPVILCVLVGAGVLMAARCANAGIIVIMAACLSVLLRLIPYAYLYPTVITINDRVILA